MTDLKQKILAKADNKEYFVKLVEQWQTYWMNQRQNSKEDYENYWRRAFGVDANMRHHLADMLSKDPLLTALADAVEALEGLRLNACCFCDLAIGHPLMSSHDKSCVKANAALAEVRKLVEP